MLLHVQLSQYVRLTEGVIVRGRQRADLEMNKNLITFYHLNAQESLSTVEPRVLIKKTPAAAIYISRQSVTF